MQSLQIMCNQPTLFHIQEVRTQNPCACCWQCDCCWQWPQQKTAMRYILTSLLYCQDSIFNWVWIKLRVTWWGYSLLSILKQFPFQPSFPNEETRSMVSDPFTFIRLVASHGFTQHGEEYGEIHNNSHWSILGGGKCHLPDLCLPTLDKIEV